MLLFSFNIVSCKDNEDIIEDVIENVVDDPEDYADVFVQTDDIGEWSEMRIHKDGSFQIMKINENTNSLENLLMILPEEKEGSMYSYIKFDENEMPKSIVLNDCVIFVDRYYDGYIDLTIAYNDTIAYSVDSLSYNASISRSYAENNWQRNTIGVVEIASGVIGVVGGSLLITGSILSEVGTFGGATPVSIPGIIAGSTTIAGGISSLRTGYEKLYMPGSNVSNAGETIYFQMASALVQDGPQNNYIPIEYQKYLKDPNYSKNLSKSGWVNFWAGLSAGICDNLYGKTITWDNLVQFYQGKLITGLNKDITSNSVLLRGYVDPVITISLLDGKKVKNEYGILLFSEAYNNERQLKKMENGDGGLIEYSFYGLQEATIYNYRSYYIDKTNNIGVLGEVKSFTTESENYTIQSVYYSQIDMGVGELYAVTTLEGKILLYNDSKQAWHVLPSTIGDSKIMSIDVTDEKVVLSMKLDDESEIIYFDWEFVKIDNDELIKKIEYVVANKRQDKTLLDGDED